MTNIYARKLCVPFDQAVAKLSESLNRNGFGVVTTINVKNIFREKLNIDFRNYTILGACVPEFAYKAISLESHIGVMLPCNLVVQQHENGEIEISAMNPMETIEKILETPSLVEVANEVSARLRKALDDLNPEKRGIIEVDAIPQPCSGPVQIPAM